MQAFAEVWKLSKTTLVITAFLGAVAGLGLSGGYEPLQALLKFGVLRFVDSGRVVDPVLITTVLFVIAVIHPAFDGWLALASRILASTLLAVLGFSIGFGLMVGFGGGGWGLAGHAALYLFNLFVLMTACIHFRLAEDIREMLVKLRV